jgi:tocopherol O-methyltransferase
MQNQSGQVLHYYDRNNSWMRLFGQGRGEAAIHRPVWLGNESCRRKALHTVDRLIAESVLPVQPSIQSKPGARANTLQILDLGCGVGGSALWLAEHYPFRVTGITVSPLQARTAGKLALRRGLSDRCRFLVADFTRLPRLSGICSAYAIESFAHGDDPTAFFHQIGSLLPAGGRLILCDDFIAPGDTPGSERREAWLSRFKNGWHLHSLMGSEEVVRLAAEWGFRPVQTIDLTPHLRATPAAVSAAQSLLGSILRRTAWGSSMHGGNALQVCQKHGWTEYLFLVLERG